MIGSQTVMIFVLPRVWHQFFNLHRYVSTFLGAMFAQQCVRISCSFGAVYHGRSVTGMSTSHPHDAVGASPLRWTHAQPKECLVRSQSHDEVSDLLGVDPDRQICAPKETCVLETDLRRCSHIISFRNHSASASVASHLSPALFLFYFHHTYHGSVGCVLTTMM
jgi:hypothetical protein